MKPRRLTNDTVAQRLPCRLSGLERGLNFDDDHAGPGDLRAAACCPELLIKMSLRVRRTLLQRKSSHRGICSGSCRCFCQELSCRTVPCTGLIAERRAPWTDWLYKPSLELPAERMPVDLGALVQEADLDVRQPQRIARSIIRRRLSSSMRAPRHLDVCHIACARAAASSLRSPRIHVLPGTFSFANK